MLEIFKSGCGTLRYSEDVIERIAYIAAKSVEGVKCVFWNAKDIIKSTKGIKCSFEGAEIVLTANICIDFDKNTLKTAINVQKAVKNIVEIMTGFTVKKVNVNVLKLEGRHM